MKTWKYKVNIPNWGICTVKEASDKEATGLIAPYSHGFVNLYQNGKWLAWCGCLYAERHAIKGDVFIVEKPATAQEYCKTYGFTMKDLKEARARIREELRFKPKVYKFWIPSSSSTGQGKNRLFVTKADHERAIRELKLNSARKSK